MNLLKFYLLIATIWLYIVQANAKPKSLITNSYAASTEALKRLLDIEEMLLGNLGEYVDELKQKLALVQRSLLHFRAEQLKMLSDEEFFHNPLHSFALLRHQQEDWLKWAAYMEELPGMEYKAYAEDLRSELPTKLDLQEASSSIELLVDYYELEPKELAVGRLLGTVQSKTALTTLDCYALGKFNLFRKNYEKAENWLNISLEKYGSNPTYSVFNFGENDIQKWLAVVLFNRGENSAGLAHLERAISIKSDDTTLFFETKANIWKLCPAPSSRGSNLHCRYNNWMTPFLRLAPLKMEELNEDPLAVLYYDAIYESEMEWFLNNSVKFAPSLLEMNELSLARTAQNFNFKDDASEVTRTLHRRIVDMTGFSMEGGDYLSMINYGIGGHYVTHLDAFPKEVEDRGNRIATTLFYLGHVELGGATVFPRLNLTVQPGRGTALVWHNLENDGTPHPKSWHSACPVVVGSKYVLTKWIYSKDQMFIKPCSADLGASVS